MNTASGPSPIGSGRTGPWYRHYAFFILAMLPVLMFSIDGTIVAVALPTMTAELHTTLPWIGWTLTGFQLAMAVGLPLAGKLADTVGRLRVFLVSVLLFTLGSLFCGLAPNVYWLILFRIVQAIGGAGAFPSAAGLVVERYPLERDRLLGLFTTIFPLGGIIGPNLGAALLAAANWRFIFLVNVPIGVLILVGLGRYWRAQQARSERPLDFVGAAFFAVAVSACLLALTLLGNDAAFWRTPWFWGLLAASLVLGALFLRQEVHTAEPIMDLALIVRPPFLAVNVYNFFFGSVVFSLFSFLPLYAVLQYGMSTAESGAILTPRSILAIGVSAYASLSIAKLGYRLPMAIGVSLTTVTLVLLALGWKQWTIGPITIGSFWLVAAEIGFAGIGNGLSAPASNNAALDLLPGSAAVLTGVRGMFRSLGGVIATALIVMALGLSQDQAATLRSVFVVLAVIMLSLVPLSLAIPETSRKRRATRRHALTPE